MSENINDSRYNIVTKIDLLMLNLLKYKSIFVSDVHLGTKGCQANKLLEFFKYTRSENLYLVGDIIDIWAMQKSFHWPQCTMMSFKKY